MEALPAVTKHQLIVTTAAGVYSWNNRGSIELFSSNSKGIVASRNMQTDKDLLAIADSQIVILHDVEKGMQRTYRLRNQDQGYIRKLFYHPDKQRLFFTTSLENAVQSFSLQKLEVLDAAPKHPSPPTVFAVSPACDLLVSASADPPTVYVSRITCKQPPLLVIPNCSNTHVVSICFHPTRANVFALGFQDGTIAAYNASVIPDSQLTEERFSYARIYGEISHLTGLHNQENNASSSAKSPVSEDGKLVGASTISGMQFIRNRTCSIVSVGTDRNCFIVDFQSNGRREAKVMESWNVQAAATSLAILNYRDRLTQADGPNDEVETDGILLAVGKKDGKVSIYNQTGQLLATRDFSKDGRILDLEWTQRSKDKSQPKLDERNAVASQSSVIQAGQPRNSTETQSSTPRLSSKGSQSPTRSRIMVKLYVKDPPPEDYLLREKTSTQSIDKQLNPSASSLDGNAISLPQSQPATKPEQSIDHKEEQNTYSEIETNVEGEVASIEKPNGNGGHQTRLRQSSRTTIRSSGSSTSSKRAKFPQIPVRPTPRPGGKLALRRIESARFRRKSKSKQSSVPTEVVSAVTIGRPQFNNVDHEFLRRPKMYLRHRSSRISPLTEAIEPHFQQTSPIPSSPLATIPLTPKSPSTPVQYNRLVRSHWELDSGSSVSRSSIYHDSSTKISLEPLIETKHATNPAIRTNVVSSPKARLAEEDLITTPTISDSGTSADSILDWTPSQSKQPTYVPYSRMISPDLRSMPGVAALISNQTAANHNPILDSDSSITSHLDWHHDRKSNEVKGFEMLKTSQEPESSLPLEKTEQLLHPSVPLPYPAPLNYPKLRKQQTVINLKETKEIPTHTRSERTLDTANKPEVDPSASKPRMSDPGPSRLRSPNTFSIQQAVKEEDQPLPPMSPSIPRSSITPTTRRSSQLKGILSLPQMRSGSTAGSQSMYTIEDVIRIEYAAICTHIDVGFQEQKGWLQGFMKEQNWYVQRLEEENRLLREELARLRKV